MIADARLTALRDEAERDFNAIQQQIAALEFQRARVSERYIVYTNLLAEEKQQPQSSNDTGDAGQGDQT